MKNTQKKYDQLYKEYYNLQNLHGSNWVNMLLGNLTSYKGLRDLHSYQEINEEIVNLQN
tara:strand:+ start:168 stop:344 length:177 start_codon:yes stop_codon:yes gene_type:complete